MQRLFKTLPVSLLCLGLTVRASPSHAQATSSAEGEPGAPPNGAVPLTEGEPEATRLIEQAKALFGEGRFREALPLLERLYALTGAPRDLFNLGVLHHQLSECEPARRYYERYLAEDPEGSARSEASWALQELHAHCPASPPPEQSPPGPASGSPAGEAPARAPALEQPRAKQKAAAPLPAAPLLTANTLAEARALVPSERALVFLGVGAAVGVAALVSLGLQSRAQHDIDALRAPASREDEEWESYEPERSARVEHARFYRQLSILLGLGFTALAGTGTALWMLDASSDSSLDLSLAAPGLSYRGRF